MRAAAEAEGLQILGPAPAPIARVKGLYRWHLLAKGASSAALSRFLAIALREFAGLSGIGTVLDRDPVNMM